MTQVELGFAVQDTRHCKSKEKRNRSEMNIMSVNEPGRQKVGPVQWQISTQHYVQTQGIRLRHPSSNHCHNWLRRPFPTTDITGYDTLPLITDITGYDTHPPTTAIIGYYILPPTTVIIGYTTLPPTTVIIGYGILPPATAIIDYGILHPNTVIIDYDISCRNCQPTEFYMGA